MSVLKVKPTNLAGEVVPQAPSQPSTAWGTMKQVAVTNTNIQTAFPSSPSAVMTLLNSQWVSNPKAMLGKRDIPQLLSKATPLLQIHLPQLLFQLTTAGLPVKGIWLEEGAEGVSGCKDSGWCKELYLCAWGLETGKLQLDIPSSCLLPSNTEPVNKTQTENPRWSQADLKAVGDVATPVVTKPAPGNRVEQTSPLQNKCKTEVSSEASMLCSTERC